MQATQIIPFKFEAHEVRTLLIDDQPWFVAADVCQSLAIVNTARALSRLDDDEKGVHSMNTLGGTQNLSAVNESGLYSLILTSRKTEAKRFKKWITAEVLPAIRKTGSYTAPNQEPAAPSLVGRRWLVSFDHDGKECVSPVANDALVMPLTPSHAPG
jgi:prophage antirepressor-like protein